MAIGAVRIAKPRRIAVAFGLHTREAEVAQHASLQYPRHRYFLLKSVDIGMNILPLVDVLKDAGEIVATVWPVAL